MTTTAMIAIALYLLTGLALYFWVAHRVRDGSWPTFDRFATAVASVELLIPVFLCLWPVWAILFVCRR